MLKQFHEAWSRVIGDINCPVEDRLVQKLLFPCLRRGDALLGFYYRVKTLLVELHFEGSGPDSDREDRVTIRQLREVLRFCRRSLESKRKSTTTSHIGFPLRPGSPEPKDSSSQHVGSGSMVTLLPLWLYSLNSDTGPNLQPELGL